MLAVLLAPTHSAAPLRQQTHLSIKQHVAPVLYFTEAYYVTKSVWPTTRVGFAHCQQQAAATCSYFLSAPQAAYAAAATSSTQVHSAATTDIGLLRHHTHTYTQSALYTTITLQWPTHCTQPSTLQ